MDGKQIFIFGNTDHGKPWEGNLTRLNILPPIPLGEFFPASRPSQDGPQNQIESKPRITALPVESEATNE